MENLVESLVESLENQEPQEDPQEEPIITGVPLFETEEKMSYVEDYYKRKDDEERQKREQEISEHLKGLCGFEEKQPEKLDTDELINRMHAVTKKELESLIKG